MSRDVELHPRQAKAYFVVGLVATVGSLLLLVTGRAAMVTWTALGLGLASLLVGAAQRSALRER